MGFSDLPRDPRQKARTRRQQQMLRTLSVAFSDIFGITDGQVTISTIAPNFVLVGPASGANATPTFRALVAADLANIPAAADATIGGVLRAAARVDSGQISVTLGTVTNPPDSPASADALRDHLVAHALVELQARDTALQTAIQTLATEFNDLLAKVRTAGQLHT